MTDHASSRETPRSTIGSTASRGRITEPETLASSSQRRNQRHLVSTPYRWGQCSAVNSQMPSNLANARSLARFSSSRDSPSISAHRDEASAQLSSKMHSCEPTRSVMRWDSPPSWSTVLTTERASSTSTSPHSLFPAPERRTTWCCHCAACGSSSTLCSIQHPAAATQRTGPRIRRSWARSVVSMESVGTRRDNDGDLGADAVRIGQGHGHRVIVLAQRT